jgi:acetyl-CoA C-acetyltransferase/acetyl-CoA acyltransferase
MSALRLVIVDGVRTPFCKWNTSFAPLGADELGRVAVSALLTRTGLDPRKIDEVIFGCVCQPAETANIARVIALRAGVPESVPASTVHRNCASGFEAVTTACERMAAGRGSVFVVGGAENMSQVPLLFKQSTAKKYAALGGAKTFMKKLAALGKFRLSDFEPRVALKLGLTDPVSGLNMGETAEILAREHGISREAQDEFAAQSHQRAVAAREKFAGEICPVYVNGKAITEDNGPRADTSPAVLAKLKPVFDRRYGAVTAGNSSQISDGAVALLVMTEEKAA